MQVPTHNNVEMTRDMDLIRELLLRIESDPIFNGTQWVTSDALRGVSSQHTIEEINYHLGLLIEAGFVRGNPVPFLPSISKLTWQGHEFVDDIKDKNIWAKTKERIKGLSGVAISVVGEIAKAEIKAKLGLP